MGEPMALVVPPLKDLPLLDLGYRRVFAALDVPTVVTIVLGFLCLEKKVSAGASFFGGGIRSLILHCFIVSFLFQICRSY